jgi:hypothetical protein
MLDKILHFAEEHLRHISCPVQGSEEGEAAPGALLPPAQPALLTLAADGTMRVWVEVTMAPPKPPESAAAASSSPTAQRTPPEVCLSEQSCSQRFEHSPMGCSIEGGACVQASRGSRTSSFCMTLVIQPPPGAWAVGTDSAPLRVSWAVPSGPEPATGPEMRAAKVLWVVGLGPAPAADPAQGGKAALVTLLHQLILPCWLPGWVWMAKRKLTQLCKC